MTTSVRPPSRIAFAIAALTAAVLAVAPGASAAPSSFTFYGSGYGHGIGMSQWGALGLARMGWGHARILTHFFSGTDVARRGDLPSTIRVELVAGVARLQLGARGGPVGVWVGEPHAGTPVGTIPGGATWTVRAQDGRFAVLDGDGNLVGGRTWGGTTRRLFLTYEQDGARVFIPEADQIWGHGFSYARGVIDLDLYGCTAACRIRGVVQLGFEEYLYGLGEVPSSWPVEVLRAQAVAARSYAAATIRRQGGLRPGCDCHLTDGAGDQVYVGASKERSTDGDRWVGAVRDTRGRVVVYGGAIVQAFYAASDGGHTENVEDVWHGGNDAYRIPWLRGVCDPGESTTGNPWLNWQVTMSADQVTSRLRPSTGAIGRVVGFGPVRRGVSGRIVSVVVRGTDGRATISGSRLRAALGLRDVRVWINVNRNVVPGAIRERYDALGCRPGLPTSRQRALTGGSEQLFSRGGIFHNDRVDLTVWLRGGVFDEYEAVGLGEGRLGLPVSKVASLAGAERGISCTRCGRVRFERGVIFFKPTAGVHALWGRVLTTYLDAGGPAGPLGFPTSRVRALPSGGGTATFEHGVIRCPTGQACVVERA
jgi:SpoIID/LytB domain protein